MTYRVKISSVFFIQFFFSNPKTPLSHYFIERKRILPTDLGVIEQTKMQKKKTFIALIIDEHAIKFTYVSEFIFFSEPKE